jgi:hypothetical protein
MSEEKIQVSVRVRPLNKREVAANEKSGWRVVDGVSILPSEKGSAQGFTFGGSPLPQPGEHAGSDFANLGAMHGGRPCIRRGLDAEGRVQGLRVQHHRVHPQRTERFPLDPGCTL